VNLFEKMACDFSVCFVFVFTVVAIASIRMNDIRNPCKMDFAKKSSDATREEFSMQFFLERYW